MKKRRRVLALFISIFLRNRSLSDARWFCGKKRKIGKGNLYLTENRLSWNVMCCASDNHNYMCHTCAKEIFEFELQLRSYWQNIKLSRYCPEFPIFTNFVIFQVYMAMRFYVSPFPLHCTVYKVSRHFESDDHIFIIIHLSPIKVYIFWKEIVPGIQICHQKRHRVQS